MGPALTDTKFHGRRHVSELRSGSSRAARLIAAASNSSPFVMADTPPFGGQDPHIARTRSLASERQPDGRPHHDECLIESGGILSRRLPNPDPERPGPDSCKKLLPLTLTRGPRLRHEATSPVPKDICEGEPMHCYFNLISA